MSLDGVPIDGLPSFRRARLGIGRSFQELRLIRELTALENVLLGVPTERDEHLFGVMARRLLRRADQSALDKAMECLAFVGLTAVAAKPAGSLSFGQQKLLSLACCLALEARALLLDEPLSGVHPLRAKEIQEVLLRAGKAGIAVVFVEHAIETVLALAQHVVVLHEGAILGEGSPGDVLTRSAVTEAYAGRAWTGTA